MNPPPLGFPLDEIRSEAIDHLHFASQNITRLRNAYHVNLWDASILDGAIVAIASEIFRLKCLARPSTTVEDPTLFDQPTPPPKRAPSAPVPIAETPTTTSNRPPLPTLPRHVSNTPRDPIPPQSDAHPAK